MAEVGTPLMRDFEIAVIFKTASGKESRSIVLDSAAELDAIIATSANLHQDPITEISVDTVWHNYTKENTLYLALDWVYIPAERKFYQGEVEE